MADVGTSRCADRGVGGAVPTMDELPPVAAGCSGHRLTLPLSLSLWLPRLRRGGRVWRGDVFAARRQRASE